MKVFVSWSGSLSQGVATILHEYLDCIIQDLKVFVSKHDIESGARWASRLAEELEDTDFGILCLSPESLHEDWLLFEAGALTKKMKGRACGLLIDGLSAADVSGPLAQFQHQVFQREGFRALLVDINDARKAPLEPRRLDMLFEKFWPDINAAYEKAVNSSRSDTSAQPQREERDILEEVLGIVRNISQRSGPLRFHGLESKSLPASMRIVSLVLLSDEDQSLYRRLDTVVALEDFGEAARLAEQQPEACERLIAADLVGYDPSGRLVVKALGRNRRLD